MTDRGTWLRARHIWNEPEALFVPGALLIRGGRIEVLEWGQPNLPADMECIDLRERWILPGLINTHVHLEFSASDTPLREFYAEDDGEHLLRAAGNAHRLLMSGVTTVRDCGSSWAMLALARRPDLSPVALPRLLLSGPPITVPAGHLHFMHGVVRNDADIVAHVERLVDLGGQSVKVMASGGAMTPGSDPAVTVFEQSALDLIASEARRHAKPSVSHVLATESIVRSARARIGSLEHCAFFERDAAGRIVRNYKNDVAMIVRDSGSAVMANISTATRSLDTVREKSPRSPEEDHAVRQFDLMVENCGRLSDMGIPIVCGTDAGVRDTPFEDTWLELVWLCRAGLSAAEAIRSATQRSARVLGLEGETGAIAPGLAADIIATDDNPLDNLSTLAQPSFVMSMGRIICQPVAIPQEA